MAKQGARVIIASHDPERLQQAQVEIRSLGYEVSSVVCNITCQTQIDDLVARVLTDYGYLDILVNNAGYAIYETFEESNLAEILRLVDVNLLGAIRCIKGFLPSMIRRRSGQIVNMASIAGRLVMTPNGTYSAAKHGLVALSEVLRYELGHFGIKVNVICPGRVKTAFFDHETFQKRAPRPEANYTIPIEKVSKETIRAIEKDRFVTYVPSTLGLLIWLTNAFPFIAKPIVGKILISRIQTLYASKQM
jgi:hypothetical protein